MSGLSSPGHGLGCKGWLTVCRRKMWHGPRTQMLRQCPSSTLGNLLHTRAPGVSFGSLDERITILDLGLCGSDCVDARWLLQMDANSCRLPRPAVPLRGAALWGGPRWRRRRRAKSTEYRVNWPNLPVSPSRRLNIPSCGLSRVEACMYCTVQYR